MNGFADTNQISSWAIEGVGFMSHIGILSGTGNNRVSPKGSATREQAIALMIRTYLEFTE